MYVAQEDLMGCGIACVANACRINYEQAKQYFDPQYANSRGYFCVNLKSALGRLGKSYRHKKSSSGVQLEGAIVFIGCSTTFPEGHYLAFINGVWVDPWINFSEDNDIKNAKAGVRESLPGTPEWIVYPS